MQRGSTPHLPQGKPEDDYRVQGIVGVGSFGVVRKVQRGDPRETDPREGPTGRKRSGRGLEDDTVYDLLMVLFGREVKYAMDPVETMKSLGLNTLFSPHMCRGLFPSRSGHR